MIIIINYINPFITLTTTNNNSPSRIIFVALGGTFEVHVVLFTSVYGFLSHYTLPSRPAAKGNIAVAKGAEYMT